MLYLRSIAVSLLIKRSVKGLTRQPELEELAFFERRHVIDQIYSGLPQ